MKIRNRRINLDNIPASGRQGALIALSSLPIILAGAIEGRSYLTNEAEYGIGIFAGILYLLAATLTYRLPRIAAIVSFVASYLTIRNVFTWNLDIYGVQYGGEVTFLSGVILILFAFTVTNVKNYQKKSSLKKSGIQRAEANAKSALVGLMPISFIAILGGMTQAEIAPGIRLGYLYLLGIICSTFAYKLILNNTRKKGIFFGVGTLLGTIVTLYLSTNHLFYLMGCGLVMPIILFLAPRRQPAGKNVWIDFMLQQPARVLIVTFFALCTTGTLLLSIPAATTAPHNLLDSLFTAVSASCITGLSVLDTSKDFTLFGQIIILLLIQLGGLGIISITTVTLQVLGKRLSLKQERMLTNMTDTDHSDLLKSLRTIIKVTFISEGVGALILFLAFMRHGDPWLQALWRGIFTSISAFCNAGFSLQSASLVPYQNDPWLLVIVSCLIIIGGFAPTTTVFIPRWLRGQAVANTVRIPLIASLWLLILGTVGILTFEFNGTLEPFSLLGKVTNAWFHSASLRTAGFNAIDISAVSPPTFMLMIILMLIGGSPGGTAGGIKTTTIGLLALTFWNNVNNRTEVMLRNRLIPHANIYRAITIIFAGMVMWLMVLLMLEVTQNLPARDLLFEASSAIATVGLTTGATSGLNEFGKVIIIVTMFLGRIGPITLFMLLSRDTTDDSLAERAPRDKVSLT